MSDGEERRRWKPPANAKTEGRADLQSPLRKALKPSSRAWVERQLNDPYVRRAQAEGWRSRAAFKLIELNERFELLSKASRVIDLGAAPGGWTQVALRHGVEAIVGVDLLPMEPISGAALMEMDFLDAEAPSRLIEALGGPPTLILSDMAANTTGHRATDQIKTGALAEAAAEFALEALAPGGAFVSKAFQGGLEKALLAQLRRAFADVRHAKPPASRQQSPEIYVIARGFRGAQEGD